MAIHTLFSSGRLPENERGGIAQLQQGAVWIVYKPLLRVPFESRALFAVWFRSKTKEGAADPASVLPKSTPSPSPHPAGIVDSVWSQRERTVEEETRVLSPLAP